MGFNFCELFGYGKKPAQRGRQFRPARDPPEFKSGVLADTGILWVQFFRKLLIPKHVAAEYSKEPCPPESDNILRQCRQARKAKREKCKCYAKCNKRNESKLMDSDRCKEYRDKLKAEGEIDGTELKAERFEAKTDSLKCGSKSSTTTIYCDKCNRCTRIIDCTGRKNE